jgi:hypothetical protein
VVLKDGHTVVHVTAALATREPANSHHTVLASEQHPANADQQIRRSSKI